MYKTGGVVASLIVACIFVSADELAPQPKAAKAKIRDEPKKKAAKPPVPSGYEDAPEASTRQPARKNGIRDFLREPGEEAVAVERIGDDIERILEIKVDAQGKQREAQFLPQLAPLMTAELSFIHRTCHLSLEQRQKIKAQSDRCLKAAVRMYAMSQNGRVRGFQGRRVETIPDPSELMHQTLSAVLQETLRPEQRTAYDDQMAQRRAYRQRIAVEALVAMIDTQLYLTGEQRQKLTESLDQNWQPSWVQPLEMLINNSQNLPSIPDQFVLPVLSESQQKVWRTATKVNYRSWGGFGWGNQLGAVDDFPLDETAGE